MSVTLAQPTSLNAKQLWLLAALLCLLLSGSLAAETTELQRQLVEQRIATMQEQGETAEGSATLRAYQETRDLKLSEVWALPTTLRVVLVENLRRLAEGLPLQHLVDRRRGY